jgi:hypothetical protein
MLDPWPQALEPMEAINQDPALRQILLRMAGLARGGRLGGFIDAVHADIELDQETKNTVLQLARDERFLFACEDYFRATRFFH